MNARRLRVITQTTLALLVGVIGLATAGVYAVSERKLMPSEVFTHLSDDDMGSLIAYLRS